MIRLLLLTALIIVGCACSRTDLAYRNADRLLSYYAWKTVDPTPAQRDQWQPVLDDTIQQHRREELPQVIAYLELAGRIIREEDASGGTACLVDSAQLLYQRHARLAADLSAPLLADLDAAQVRHLDRYTSKRRKDAIERYLDPDPARRKASRQERIMERIEDWTGDLDKSQRQQVSEALERIPDLSEPWLSYRAQQTAKLLGMLEAGSDEKTVREHLDGWWVDQEDRSDEYQRQWRIARHEFIRFMDELGTTLTEKQRRSIQKRLAELREDLAGFLSPAQQPVSMPMVPACMFKPV